MNTKQWNAAMFTAMIALAVVAVPFFAIASDFGGFSDFIGISDIDFGIQNTADLEDSSDMDFAVTDWDQFDGDLGPFDDIPGNPAGDDVHIAPTIVPVIEPIVPPVVPPESPITPSPESEDYLSIFIHSIFVNSAYGELSGNTVPLLITFENTGTKHLENTKVIVMIPDLSVRASVGPLYLNAGEKATSAMFLDLPEDTAPGIYPVRIQIYNENTNRIVHREIEVIDY